MDAAVHNQFLQGQPGNLPADRVKAGDGNGFGGVVDNQVHAGDGFQGADVPALPANDPALHLVVGQGHHGDGGLGGVIRGTALNGGGNDLPALLLGLVLHLLFDFLDLHGNLVADFLLHGLEQILLGFLLGQLGDLLQGLLLLLFQLLGLGHGVAGFLQLFGQLLLLALEGLGFLVQGGFLLLQTALLFAQLRPALFDFPFVLCA